MNSISYKLRRSNAGFTLVEVVICMILVMIAGLSTIGAIIYTRLSLENEKQQLAALNYARQAIDAANSLDDVYAGTKSLVPFNTPGIDDLSAAVSIEYYPLTDDGEVDWTSPTLTLSTERPIFTRVNVSWIPHGSRSRPQLVSMSSIITKGIN